MNLVNPTSSFRANGQYAGKDIVARDKPIASHDIFQARIALCENIQFSSGRLLSFYDAGGHGVRSHLQNVRASANGARER